MEERSRYVSKNTRQNNEEETCQEKPRSHSRADSGSRKNRQCCGDLQEGECVPELVLSLAPESSRGHDKEPPTHETWSEGKRCGEGRVEGRSGNSTLNSLRSDHRASIAQKKRELGLHGCLKGRHLAKPVRDELLKVILEAREAGETMTAICSALELERRSVYRWINGQTSKSHHGGGGGHNRIKPIEEKRVIDFARKNSHFRCRRIAYELERQAKVFIGKTKVSEILKENGLGHTFERKKARAKDVPSDMLLHEPWAKNLIWGSDWSWVKVGDRFMYLLVVVDWYSRKIVALGALSSNNEF